MSEHSESIFDSDLSDLAIPGFEAPVEAAPAEAAPEVEAAAPAEQPVVGEPDPAATPEAKAPAAAKVLKFKAGEKEIALDEGAIVPWKIDGKTEMVAVKDLLSNYAGKVAYDRKFQELSKQREEALQKVSEFETGKARHTKLITDMHKSVTEGKTFDAVQSMLEMSGLDKRMDSRQFVKQLRESLIEQAKQLAGLTPEQREVHDIKEESDFLKAKYARETQQRASDEAEKAFQTRVAKSVEQAGSTVEEFVKTRDFLHREITALKGNVSDITPEYVANHIKDVRDYGTAKEALLAVNPELVKNEKLWDDSVKYLRMNPDWTAKDLEDVLRRATTQKRTATINSTVKQSPVASAASATTKKPATDPRLDMKSFNASDLDW